MFSSFSDEDLSLFAVSFSEIELEPHGVLFAEGDAGRDMFILLEGSLQVLKENRTITSLSPIDYIGEMAIIEDKPRSATIISNTKSKLLRITYAQFQDFFSTQPQSLVSMMKTLSRRIRIDTELLSEEFQKANILIHDMRNTMTGLLLLDLLEKETLTDSQHRYIHLMQKNRQQLMEMSNEALANAKRLQYTPVLEKNSLPQTISEIQESVIYHPDLHDKHIVCDIQQDFPDFLFYKIDIVRVVTNVIINAGQASKAGDSISIKLFQQNNHAVLEIKDQGCGIPRTIQSKIFLPHFTTKESGNGFGLASCKQLIEIKHGGTISFESEAGSGTTFTLTLPMSHKVHPSETTS